MKKHRRFCSLIVLTVLCVTLSPSQTTLRFGVIGDFGWAGQPEADVAAMLDGWNPDIIITTGDNNYESGAESTIDQNIGQYYSGYIHPYNGAYGPGDTVNRFFPVLGNHDWIATDAQPYLDYFTLPGNERYYDFVRGPVHFLMIDSDSHEPDGRSSTSTQALWLQAKLAASTSPWKIVVFHQPPYTSGSTHGNTTSMQWPFAAWGADAVLTGHEHIYERIVYNGMVYFVNGLGGRSRYSYSSTPVEGSVVRYNTDFGAQVVDASPDSIRFRFFTRTGSLVDDYTIVAEPSGIFQFPVSAGWNLVSVPLDAPSQAVADLFPSAVGDAYTYSGNAYVPADTIRPGTGYWLKFPYVSTLHFDGTPRTADTVQVVPGWNLVGAPFLPAPVSSIIEEPASIVATSFFGYDLSYSAADTLRPGMGYWVKVSGAGTLIIPGSGEGRR